MACRTPRRRALRRAAARIGRWSLPCTLAAAALGAGPARAGQPLLTETADVIGAGHCQLETSLGSLHESGAPRQQLADAVGSCGWGRHTEAGLTLAGLRASGASDRLVGLKGKTLLAMPADGAASFALAYSLWWSRPAGEAWGLGGSRLFGVASRGLTEHLLGHLNLGWLRTERNRLSHTTWSLGVESDGDLGWAADLFGDDRSRPWLSGGVKLPLADKVSASLACAQALESSRPRLWTLGLKLEFL